MAITISGSGITSANILDGTIAAADLANTYLTPTGDGSGLSGTGKVLQVVHSSDGVVTDTTSTTYVTTSSLAYTPLAVGNKLLVTINASMHFNTRHADYDGAVGWIGLYIGGSLEREARMYEVAEGSVLSSVTEAEDVVVLNTLYTTTSLSDIDIEIKVKAQGTQGQARSPDSSNNGENTITVMEISS